MAAEIAQFFNISIDLFVNKIDELAKVVNREDVKLKNESARGTD